MKLVTFDPGDGKSRAGTLTDSGIADLSARFGCIEEIIRGGASALVRAKDAIANAPHLDRSAVRLLAPFRPGKVLCSGVNYHALVVEAGMSAPPSEPFFFAKLPTLICGCEDAVVKPARTEQLDWEAELAAVIGAPLHLASEAEVMDAVFGYTLLNDLSARDIQAKDHQITLGKNFANFAPIGPCVVTADELSDISDIRITTHVNGEKMQDDTSRNWIFSLPQMVSFLSHVMPLEPGDIVTAGTTAGLGLFMKPPRFLQPGDIVEIAASCIGSLSTRIVASTA